MFEKWYKIVGLTKELANCWRAELRQDIIVWEEKNGDIEARIRLNPIEATQMRFMMKRNNKQQEYYKLGLVPVKG